MYWPSGLKNYQVYPFIIDKTKCFQIRKHVVAAQCLMSVHLKLITFEKHSSLMSQDELNETDHTLLLQQIEQGSTRAFDTLFEKYWQQAYSSAYKRLKSHDDAKDIVQEIFTHIWINRKTTHIENLPAYLHVAVRNKVIKFISKQKQSHPFFDLLDTVSEKNLYADSPLLWKEFMKAYESLLETLPPKRQAIFRLRYEKNLSTKAIATQMGINRKTVQNQLGKAVETLRVSLLRILTVAILSLINLF